MRILQRIGWTKGDKKAKQDIKESDGRQIQNDKKVSYKRETGVISEKVKKTNMEIIIKANSMKADEMEEKYGIRVRSVLEKESDTEKRKVN